MSTLQPAKQGFLRRFGALVVGVAAFMIVEACSSAQAPPESNTSESFVIPPGIEDQRGRFREIFCAVLEERSGILPDYRPCDEALTRVGAEPDGSGIRVELGRARRPLVAAFVPGIGWECFAGWLDSKATTASHLRQVGYDMVPIEVDALSSSEMNARQIRDAIMAMDLENTEPRLVLIGYSKGTSDILEAVVSYPEIRPRIAAVVSAAGAVRGSRVADEVTQSKLELLKKWPGAECSSGDGGALESLRPATRTAWLEENPLPRDIQYYSLLTSPQPERISSVLKPSYKKLNQLGGANDGMVLLEDQFIPGSTLVGCVNADHWAVSVAIARSHQVVGSTLVTRNDYPREALAEALLRFVEEDLSRPTR